MEMADPEAQRINHLAGAADLRTGNPADLDSVQQYFTEFHIERDHL